MTDNCNQPQEGRQETPGAPQAPTLDLPAIRRAAQEGLPVEQVLALIDRISALEAALRPFAEQEYSSPDALLTARRLLGLPEFPPIGEAFAQLREIVGLHFDGVDPVAFVAQLRGDDEGAIVSAARAWADAIERQDIAEIERCEGELIIAIAACS